MAAGVLQAWGSLVSFFKAVVGNVSEVHPFKGKGRGRQTWGSYHASRLQERVNEKNKIYKQSHEDQNMIMMFKFLGLVGTTLGHLSPGAVLMSFGQPIWLRRPTSSRMPVVWTRCPPRPASTLGPSFSCSLVPSTGSPPARPSLHCIVQCCLVPQSRSLPAPHTTVPTQSLPPSSLMRPVVVDRRL
eukprot:319243-Rhodomonas_salina.3